MKWNTYQDQENRAYSHILTTLFPEQTKTIPRILVWSVIFLADLILVIAGEAYLDLLPEKWEGIALVVIIVGGFWLQGFLWYGIRNWIARKREERNTYL